MTSPEENPDAPATPEDDATADVEGGTAAPRATAHPVAEPVFIQLVPFGGAPDSTVDHASAFVVASGFHRFEDPEIHRLSKIVLQLAMTNFALTFFLELIRLVGAMFSRRYIAILHFVFWIAFAYYLMWLGIRGVKTRNARCPMCGHGCEWGYLDAFRWIYVFRALVQAAWAVYTMVDLEATELVFNILLLILLAATAEYARKLLVVVNRDARASVPAGVAPTRATLDTIPMAAADVVAEAPDGEPDERPSRGGIPAATDVAVVAEASSSEADQA
mmetsp:Transcript_624/g.2467  ORF Transcript_624/g.2467 Transcript_624/m.2467 type:complete len:275 (+) Transcript_624:235-1059(+)